MAKVLPPKCNNFPLICGEIYYTELKTYKVACRSCTVTIPLEEFSKHFECHLDQQIAEHWKPQILPDDEVKSEEILDYAELEHQHKTVPFEELDEKPIDFEELRKIQMRGLEASMTIVGDSRTPRTVLVINTVEVANTNGGVKGEDFNPTWQDEDSLDTDFDIVPKRISKSAEAENESRPFTCSLCRRSYSTKRCLTNHMRTHKPKEPRQKGKVEHKCEECGETFKNKRYLSGHKTRVHIGLTCDVCSKTFTQIGNLMRHKIRHTGIKAFKCKECDYSAFTDKELKGHMLRHTGIMPIVCEICGRPCRDHGVLTLHMRRHTGERPAKCGVCGKGFFSGHDLNVHSITHTNERPFSCDVCGGTFKSKKSLRVHKLQHISERNFKCKLCSKAFALEAGLTAHMRSHDKSYIERRIAV